jgi:drug/metabolite transporter (DMT)-like permease
MFDSGKTWGLLMGLAAALIGGGWQVATRYATTMNQAPMAPQDLAILRYGIPALLLLPLWWRTGLLPAAVDRRRLAGIVAGAGLPFGLVAMTGSRLAPTAHMGVLMAGASPLIAVALAWLLWREVPDRARRVGIGFMCAAVLLLGTKSLGAWSGSSWQGDLLFVLAATLWAGYTVSFRRSGLTPWQSAAIVSAWSSLILLAGLALSGGTALWHVPWQTVLWQTVWQGLLAGVFGLWTYSVAIERLGAAPAAAFGALAPVVSSLGGWWWLGDTLSTTEGLAVAAAVIGVLLASGAWPTRQR